MTLDRGWLSVQGDEERPHPPRFIDRVTPLAGALANFPPYLRSLFLPLSALSPLRFHRRAFFLHGAPNDQVHYIPEFQQFSPRNAATIFPDDYMTNVDLVY